MAEKFAVTHKPIFCILRHTRSHAGLSADETLATSTTTNTGSGLKNKVKQSTTLLPGTNQADRVTAETLHGLAATVCSARRCLGQPTQPRLGLPI